MHLQIAYYLPLPSVKNFTLASNLFKKTLSREFENLSKDASEKIQIIFSKVTKIVNQIRSYGEELSHQKII